MAATSHRPCRIVPWSRVPSRSRLASQVSVRQDTAELDVILDNNALYEIFTEFRNPEQIVSDNGRLYISDEFATFCKSLDIRHVRSSAPPRQRQSRVICTNVQNRAQVDKGRTWNVDAKAEQVSAELSYDAAVNDRAYTGIAGIRQTDTLRTLVQAYVQTKFDKELDGQRRYHDLHARERSFKEGDCVSSDIF